MMIMIVVPSVTAAAGGTIRRRSEVRRGAGSRQLQQTKFQYPLPQNEQPGEYQLPPRVVIEPFLVKLGGMMSSSVSPVTILSQVDMEDLLTILETTATAYLQKQTTNFSERRLLTLKLEYVKFAQPVQVSSDAYWVTILVDNGVARYTDDSPPPTKEQVQNWVQESLTQDRLLPMLQLQTTNANLRSVVETTIELKNQPKDIVTTAPIAATTKAKNSSTVGAIVGASIVVIALLAILFLRKLRSNSQVVNLGEATTDSDSIKPIPLVSSSPKNNKPQSNERFGMRRAGDNHNDGRSIAGSESEWTVATEAGDSMAIKSIHPNVNGQFLVPNSPNTSALMLSESFERDRQVAITKDMLTGQWSGNVTNQRGSQVSTESVLQPSYFSATVERQNRDSRQQQQLAIVDHRADAETSHFAIPDMDSSSYSSTGTNSSERKKRKDYNAVAVKQQDDTEED